MAETFPHHDLLEEILLGNNQHQNLRCLEVLSSGLRVLSYQGCLSVILSGPSLPPFYLDIRLSTHRHSRRGKVARLTDHSRVGSVVISEAEPGDPISCAKSSAPPAVWMTPRYPKSTQNYSKFDFELLHLSSRDKSGEVPYLSHQQRTVRHRHQGT